MLTLNSECWILGFFDFYFHSTSENLNQDKNTFISPVFLMARNMKADNLNILSKIINKGISLNAFHINFFSKDVIPNFVCPRGT